MMHQPWDCAQPDEWLPQSLRLCWGGDGGDGGMGGGGFSGGDSGGWGGDTGGGFTGGGDWGSSGSYDASGFNAGGDLGAWAGSAYDASSFPGGTLGGGDWGSFGTTNYGGMDAPNATFADIAGPNPGVTTGGGDWGSAGAFSAAGTGGGPGGAMLGAAQGAASGLWGGGDTGGGGLFGDYGGGGGGGSYGGGGGYYGGGGQGGGGSFGGFGTTGTLGASNAVAAAPTGPTGSAFADSYGGGSLSGSAGPAAASSHSMGGLAAAAAASDAGPSESEAAPSEDAPSAAPSESQFGEPAQTEAAPSQDEAAPTQDEAAPEVSATIAGGRETNFDYGPQAAPAETETSQSNFGPQSVIAAGRETNFDYGPSQSYQQASQQLSDLTQSALAPQQDSFDSRFGFETAPQQDSFDSRFGFDVAAPQDTFDSRFGFDISALAPAIEASIPGGRETDFGYGPGPQTAPPNFNQAFEAFNTPGWDLSEQTDGRTGLAEPTDWGGNPLAASTDVSVGRDFNQVFADVNGQLTNYEGAPYADMGPPTPGPDFDQSFQAFDTPTGMDLASDFATGRTTDLSNQLGLNDLTVGPGLPTGPAFGISGLNLNPLTHDDQVVNVDIVPAPPEVQPPPQDQPQAQPEVEVQPTPEAQPAPQTLQEAPQAPPEAPQAPPQEVEQTQPQEAQPAPPSLIEQAQTLPAEVQPTAPPSLIEQAQQSPPGAPLSFPGTLTPQVQPTEAPQQAQPSVPMPQSRPADTPVPVGPFVALPGKQVTGLEANIPANPATGMPAMKGIDTTNNGKNGGPLGKVEAIITHFSGGKGYTIGALVSQMMKGGAGYNIAVDKDGTAYQLRPDGVTAGHVGDKGKPSGKGNFAGYFNNNSIGVAALAENEADLTPAQIATMKAIVTALGKANNLPPSQVFGHAAVDSNRGEGEGSTVANWAKGLAGWPSSQPPTRVVDVPRPPADIPAPANLPPPTTPPAPGRPPADIPAPGRITYYAPGGRGKEGGYATSRPNPTTGKYTPSTLDDVRLGKSDFVTLAADPRRYGESVNLGTINYRSPIDGKTYTLSNVQGIVHDTGSAFKGKLDKLDVAVGDFRGWNSAKAQAFVANNSRQQTADVAPPPAAQLQPQPPADVPAALPPPTMPLAPETRPPADIPAPTLTPPRAGRADPVMQTRAAQNILAQATAHLTTKSGEAEFTAASVVGAKAMAAAGIPVDMARTLMTQGAYAGAAKAGYGPSSMFWGIAKGKIDAGIDTALQGYQPAKPGAVQGPSSPFAPGKQGAAPFGQRYASMSQLLGEPAPEEDLGREGDVSAREAIRPWDIMPLEQLSPMIAPPAPREPPYQSPPPPQYTPGGPGMFNPFRGNEAALPFDTRFLAKGGHVDKDEPVVVGEEGPETFVPDQSGTVVPHMPQPGKGKNVDRWPKMPAVLYPGRYGGVEREIERQTRAAQDPVPALIDLVNSGRLPLNAANWDRLINNPDLIALGRSRFEDRREGIDPGAEQYGAFIAPPAPAAEPPDPTSPMAQALGYGSIKRRPMQIGRQSYSQ